MTATTLCLAILAMVLFVGNVYQFLTQRAALRIGEILYIMSRHIREKAAQVRRDGKEVEIVEAHLFGISTSARSLLRTLGRSEDSLGPDPSIDLAPNGKGLDSESLLRLADNILYAVGEDIPGAHWEEVATRALERFQEKVPSLDREAAKRIMSAVVKKQSERDINGPLTFALKDQTTG